MRHSPVRRRLLLASASLPITAGFDAWSASAGASPFAAIEAKAGGRLGVMAIDTANGKRVGHRADERFPFCSTFKVMAVSAVLKRGESEPGLLDRRIRYTREQLVSYSPISGKHLEDGMTVAELCAATIQYSDNTAANLLMNLVDGPTGVTAFASSIGDETFRLGRWETALNTSIPGDTRDTTTPAAMATSLRRLALGDALAAPGRDRLVAWMRGNTTGATRIRAGVPADWTVGDKTGTGDYGTTNDIGIVWPAGKAPLVIAVYFTRREKSARPDNEAVAAATRAAVAALV